MTVDISPFDAIVHRCAKPLSHPVLSLVRPSDAAELRSLIDITDPVERHRSGERPLFEPADDYVGNHREYVLAPFASPPPSRFSDGSFGVLYAGLEIETAIRESAYWLGVTYRDAPPPAGVMPRKIYLTMRIRSDSMADIRHDSRSLIPQSVYDPDDYMISRQLGIQVHGERREGIWYDSVRNKKGCCAGAFRPRIISNVRVQGEYEFSWNGARFAEAKPIIRL